MTVVRNSLNAGTKESIRVALLGRDLVNWGGGIDFLRLCAGALSERYVNGIDCRLLLPQSTAVQSIRRWVSPCKRLVSQLAKGERPNWNPQNRVHNNSVISSVASSGAQFETVLFPDNDSGLRDAALAEECDLVFPFTTAPTHFPVPWLGYIPRPSARASLGLLFCRRT